MSMRRPSVLASAAMGTQHYGSFYLRMGAVGKLIENSYFYEYIKSFAAVERANKQASWRKFLLQNLIFLNFTQETLRKKIHEFSKTKRKR